MRRKFEKTAWFLNIFVVLVIVKTEDRVSIEKIHRSLKEPQF
jgi:hypothetical protein